MRCDALSALWLWIKFTQKYAPKILNSLPPHILWSQALFILMSCKEVAPLFSSETLALYKSVWRNFKHTVGLYLLGNRYLRVRLQCVSSWMSRIHLMLLLLLLLLVQMLLICL